MHASWFAINGDFVLHGLFSLLVLGGEYRAFAPTERMGKAAVSEFFGCCIGLFCGVVKPEDLGYVAVEDCIRGERLHGCLLSGEVAPPCGGDDAG